MTGPDPAESSEEPSNPMSSTSGTSPPSDEPSRPAPIGDLMAAWPAIATSPRSLRDHVRGWLRTHAWPTRAGEDIVYAVNEAAENVIEHAYPQGFTNGSIELYGWIFLDPFDPGRRRAG